MFREMRRSKQNMSKERCIEVLKRGTSGVLAVLGDGDYPYAVPISYVYKDSKIYFHCAKAGHKIDAIVKHNKVSFCVIDRDKVVPEDYTTHYRSVIVFGKAGILEGEAKKTSLMDLALKYAPGDEKMHLAAIDQNLDQVCVVAVEIEHMSGKEARDIARG